MTLQNYYFETVHCVHNLKKVSETYEVREL